MKREENSQSKLSRDFFFPSAQACQSQSFRFQILSRLIFRFLGSQKYSGSMSFLPLHRDKEHKFQNGCWSWGETDASLKFHRNGSDKKVSQRSRATDEGDKFKEFISAAEEQIFRQVFQRPNSFYDSDVVTLQDIKNIALFTMNSRAAPTFLAFVHSTLFDRFLHGVVFYVDMFLMVLEFLLIRRDKALKGQVCDVFSIKVEQFLSKTLSDRRLLIAREYANVSRVVEAKKA
jgi:Protein phosphatase 1 inhibitor